VQLGTAFLCSSEAGTSSPYRQALLTKTYSETIVTRAYSGRFARGLANRFAVEHDESHGDVVAALLAASPEWVDAADHRDLTGRPRYATATRARALGAVISAHSMDRSATETAISIGNTPDSQVGNSHGKKIAATTASGRLVCSARWTS